jgi:hypothetical protein
MVGNLANHIASTRGAAVSAIIDDHLSARASLRVFSASSIAAGVCLDSLKEFQQPKLMSYGTANVCCDAAQR